MNKGKDKIGCVQEWKTKTAYFVLSFHSLASLDKIGYAQEWKTKTAYFVLSFHSLALSLQYDKL